MATASPDKKVGDYEIDTDPDKALGEGSYGKVFVGRHARSGKDVAAKLIEWEKDLVTKEMDREAELMMKIPPHTNVLGIIEYIKRDVWKGIRKKKKLYAQGWLILELCTIGNLAEYAEEKALSVVQKVDLTLQGALGLQHLHRQTPAIIHHDIKLANLLITGSEDHPVVKVADFGISKFFAHSGELSLTKRTREGTEWYLAPELFRLGENNRAEYNKAIDVFAMGVSGLSVLVARHGYTVRTYTVEVGENKKGLGRHIHEKKITDVAALIRKAGESEEVKKIKSIIATMLARDAKARPTIDVVVEQLSQLRSELGVRKLRDDSQLDTVWPPAKLRVSREWMAESPAILRAMVDQLTQMVEKKEKETLLVVDLKPGVSALWVQEGTEWTMCEISDRGWVGACVGYVSDGLVVSGGKDRPPAFVEWLASSHSYHFSLSTREWRQLQDMITPRAFASAAEMKNMMLMVVGGQTGHQVSDRSTACEVLDVKRGVWYSASALPDEMTGEVVTGAAGGRAYILGHTHKSGLRFLEYDPESDKHIPKPSPRIEVHRDFSLAGASGKIYLFYMDESYGPTPRALQYDPAPQQWHNLAPTTTVFSHDTFCGTIVKEGRILLCGTARSLHDDEPTNLIEEYNIRTQKWTILATRLPFQERDDLYLY